jgi:hypothetical protein
MSTPNAHGAGHVRPVESSFWCSPEARSFIVNPYSRQGFCNLISIFARFQRTRLSSVNASINPFAKFYRASVFVGGLSPIRKQFSEWTAKKTQTQ